MTAPTNSLADPASTGPAADRPVVATARGLTKVYGRGDAARPVLQGVDLDIRAASLTAIIGPSGSGKSTLMYCLSGLERPTGGAVTLLDVDPARTGAGRMARLYRERVSFMFQDYNLVPYLSARQNAALPGRLARRAEAIPRADAALAHLGIAEHAGTRATRLSGGQQQRTALARVLAGDPEVVFADEPTGALDTASSRLVIDQLQRRAREGAAVVLVTHDLEIASQADQAVVLIDGRIRAQAGRSSVRELTALMDPARSGGAR